MAKGRMLVVVTCPAHPRYMLVDVEEVGGDRHHHARVLYACMRCREAGEGPHVVALSRADLVRRGVITEGT